MFAGALYPADNNFLKNVEAEVRHQVKRLRKHPCIAIWCGNNEIEEAWFNWGWQKQFNYSTSDSLTLWNNYKKIFHDLVPSIVKELDPSRAYWPSSPSLGWGRDSSYKKGDVHYWGVWWGKEPVEKYREKVGRFNSEYGMQGMPDMKTIRQFALDADLDTSSVVMKTHQKHPFGYENIKLYIGNKFRTPKTFEDLVYVSQLMQADAVKTAIEAHRRNQPVTMGTMFWQWNDCWPVTSWSAIDYYGRKKALYYEVKRSYAPDVALPLYMDYQPYAGGPVIAVSGDLESRDIELQIDFIDFQKGRIAAKQQNWSWQNQRHPGWKQMPILKHDTADTNGVYVFTLLDDSSRIVNRNYYFPVEPKSLNLSKAHIKWTVSDGTIVLTSDKFAYGVYVDLPDGVELYDNYFHIIPHEKKVVKFRSAIPLETIKKKIKIKSLVDTY
jgi:beta-mannosidase